MGTFCEIKTRKEKRQSSVRKNQMMHSMLQQAVEIQRLKFRYVLVNSWFTVSSYIVIVNNSCVP
jgi:hypothetical protein